MYRLSTAADIEKTGFCTMLSGETGFKGPGYFMRHYKRILSAAVLAVLSSAADAVPFSVEARSLGMGNARVATADIATAPFANPGMLSYQPSREDFSLLIGAGALLNDSDGMVDSIDQFQEAYNNIPTNPSEAIRAFDIVQSMDGDVIAPEATAAFSTGFSGEVWAFALSARADAISAGTITELSQDPTEILDTTKNILEMEGVYTTELGFTVARNFNAFGRKLAIGLKPKYVTVENIYFSEPIATIDTSLKDLLDGSSVDLGDYTTFDLGLVMGLTEHTQIGLVATNLVSHTIKFINSSSVPAELHFDTQARLGLAYRSRFVTLGADLDLLESDALLTSPNFSALKTQFAALGAEFNAFDFMQIRIGAQKNLADGISDAAKDPMYTAGLGFWFGFNLDVAVVSQNDSLGGFLQTGFRF